MPESLSFGSLDEMIRWGGYALLFFIIFADTGLFFGFLLPGDALILTAGLVAATGKLDIVQVNLVMISAAILGDSTGYFIGKHLGRKLFEKEDSLFFKREYLLKAQAFYDAHGGKAIFFARYFPVVRNFATTVAGVAGMAYPRFIAFSVSGATVWILSFSLLGYFVVKRFPELEAYINRGIALILVVIIGTILFNLFKSRSPKPLS
ncbi:MAG: VTT domain-containing protein [Chloroherpetonaceae bacterium]|nr:VTT domain-containing protein [Chloroherpetonaceae bacterium]MDW8438105.1 VTT domain-containing protein [Chloroherpetonaceae bacterium]